MKRAQGLQFDTIIIATLVIVAVLIIVFLVAKQGLIFGKSISDCEAQSGKCVQSTAYCLEKGGQPMNFNCPPTSPACCSVS